MAEREDKRMDDLVAQVNQGFARVDGEIAGLRQDLKDTRAELRTEMQHGFARIDGQFGRVDGQFARIDRRFEQFENRMHRWGIAIFVTLLGMLGGIVAQGIAG